MAQKTICKVCGVKVEGKEKGGKMLYNCSCGHKWSGQIREFQGKKPGIAGKIIGGTIGGVGANPLLLGLGIIIGNLFDKSEPMACRKYGGNGYSTNNIQDNKQQYQCQDCRSYWWRHKK